MRYASRFQVFVALLSIAFFIDGYPIGRVTCFHLERSFLVCGYLLPGTITNGNNPREQQTRCTLGTPRLPQVFCDLNFASELHAVGEGIQITRLRGDQLLAMI